MHDTHISSDHGAASKQFAANRNLKQAIPGNTRQYQAMLTTSHKISGIITAIEQQLRQGTCTILTCLLDCTVQLEESQWKVEGKYNKES